MFLPSYLLEFLNLYPNNYLVTVLQTQILHVELRLKLLNYNSNTEMG